MSFRVSQSEAETSQPSFPYRRSSSRLPLTALWAGALGIAFAPIFVRLSPVGPSATAFWRIVLALPPLWFWMNFKRDGISATPSPSSFSDYFYLSLAGLFFAGDLAIWHWSIKLTSVANATLLVNFAPVFVTLGSWLIFHQGVRMIFLLGMALALSGMAMIAGNSFQISLQHFWGDALSFTAALFYAGYLLSVKSLRERFSTATLMAWSSLVSALALLPITLLSGESFSISSLHGWMLLIALALISQVAGQSLIAFALAHLPASFSSVALLVQPVAAAFLAWLLLKEALGSWQALGGIIVLFGILVAKQGSPSG
ncbi:MAG: DMT family transporter [Thermodesulfobacteriota bacterium]|jgi:drug/metabolite transporter (DMT)-like permease